MYFIKTPFFLKLLYPRSIWNKSRQEKKVYLTFDDGPCPAITPHVLDVLHHYGIKATFFCVGKNIEAYPALYQRILKEGHRTGNHTYNHLKGWNTSDVCYLADVEQCHRLTDSRLFRPPYARAKRSQLRALYPHYDVVMWDVMSGDFDESISPQKCLDNVVSNVENGSIVIFHDNQKAIPRVQYALPRTIEFLLINGYTIGLL